MRRACRAHVGSSLWIGLVFLTLGVLWTLDNLGFVDSSAILRWWPAVLIAIGIARLTGFAGPVRGVWGTMLISAGSLLLLNNLGFIDFGVAELWAIGLIFIGGMIVYRTTIGRSVGRGDADASDRLSAIAIMAGVDRKVQSTSFRGGDATAVMGSVELDFGSTRIEGDEAAIELLVIMGGAVLSVPADWQVVFDVTPVMGAVEDKRRAPATESKQLLRLSGFVMWGSVELQDVKDRV